MDKRSGEWQITRRTYMALITMAQGAPWWVAYEAVSSTLLDHPEIDADETATFAEWDRRFADAD